MNNSVTNFDLEAAFKALDEIEIPNVKSGVRANKVNLNETFKLAKSRKDKTDVLIEDYFDVANQSELEDAKAAREDEIAKAKLARIEKIVDLEAKSADDILPSYVGKYIIQCPQCLTLIYKNKEDLVNAEEGEALKDSDIVNVGEACQQCGNEEGYNLIGKIGAVDDESEEVPETEETEEVSVETEEEPVEKEEGSEESTEEEPVEEINLDNIELDTESGESEEETEEKKEESFRASTNSTLVEDFEDAEDDFDPMIGYVDDAYYYLNKLGYFDVNGKDQLNSVLADEDKYRNKYKKTGLLRKGGKLYYETLPFGGYRILITGVEPKLDEAADKSLAPTEENIANMLDSKEFRTPVSDAEIRAIFAANESLEDAEDIDEESVNECITEFLKNVYSNVDTFSLTECFFADKKLTLSGNIKFNSGKIKESTFEFNKTGSKMFEGFNKEITNDKAFKLEAKAVKGKIVVEKLTYSYKIGRNLVEGFTQSK